MSIQYTKNLSVLILNRIALSNFINLLKITVQKYSSSRTSTITYTRTLLFHLKRHLKFTVHYEIIEPMKYNQNLNTKKVLGMKWKPYSYNLSSSPICSKIINILRLLTKTTGTKFQLPFLKKVLNNAKEDGIMFKINKCYVVLKI